MRIQHNIMAMNAYRNYNNNTSALSKNLEKLSSGYKINRAGDDAAGLAISEKMRAQITGLNAAQKNVKDGISLVKTAEGAMQEIQDMLNRMDYLATQSANGTYDDPVDRANLQKEVNALRTEIDRIAESANFNGIKLLNGEQSLKAGEASTVVIDVTATAPTAGVAQSGGAKDIPDANFAPSGNINSGLHPGTPSATAVAPSFSINLKDLKIDGVTNGNAGSTITVTIGGGAFKATVSVGNAGDPYTGVSLANALNGATANIGGVEFTATAGADGRVTFTATTAANALGNADAINSEITGTEVEVGGTGLTPYGNWVHGLQDITLAADEVKGTMSGVSFKLDANIVKDGNKLTIGDKTYVFKVGNDSTTTAATSETLITVKDTTTASLAEAARQMADSTQSIGDPDNAGEVFKISSITHDGTIHIDQQNNATGTQPKTYTATELKGLFSLEEPTRNEIKASIELSAAAADSGVVDGDRVLYNGKSYIIGTAPADADAETAKSYMSAASFNEMLATDATNSLKAAADEVLAAGTFAGKYTATLADGKVKIEALKGDNLDTADVMNAIKGAIDAKVADMKITKLDKDNVGKGGLNLQIGDTSEPFNQMAVQIGDMHTKAMGTMETMLDGGLQTAKAGESIADIDISTAENASKAIDVIKNAINYVSSVRGDLGAIQNRLEHTQNNLSVMAENIQDAESTIRDTDVAEEMMSYVKNNILVQSAQAMLAQANQVPQGVLQLLG